MVAKEEDLVEYDRPNFNFQVEAKIEDIYPRGQFQTHNRQIHLELEGPETKSSKKLTRPKNKIKFFVALGLLFAGLVVLLVFISVKNSQKDADEEDYFEEASEEESFSCELDELYTIDGCATCQDAFPDCNRCYVFKGNSDGSDLYSTPIYHSPEDRTVKEYWACSSCNTDFDLDFYGQSCT